MTRTWRPSWTLPFSISIFVKSKLTSKFAIANRNKTKPTRPRHLFTTKIFFRQVRIDFSLFRMDVFWSRVSDENLLLFASNNNDNKCDLNIYQVSILLGMLYGGCRRSNIGFLSCRSFFIRIVEDKPSQTLININNAVGRVRIRWLTKTF